MSSVADLTRAVLGAQSDRIQCYHTLEKTFSAAVAQKEFTAYAALLPSVTAQFESTSALVRRHLEAIERVGWAEGASLVQTLQELERHKLQNMVRTHQLITDFTIRSSRDDAAPSQEEFLAFDAQRRTLAQERSSLIGQINEVIEVLREEMRLQTEEGCDEG